MTEDEGMDELIEEGLEVINKLLAKLEITQDKKDKLVDDIGLKLDKVLKTLKEQ